MIEEEIAPGSSFRAQSLRSTYRFMLGSGIRLVNLISVHNFVNATDDITPFPSFTRAVLAVSDQYQYLVGNI